MKNGPHRGSVPSMTIGAPPPAHPAPSAAIAPVTWAGRNTRCPHRRRKGCRLAPRRAPAFRTAAIWRIMHLNDNGARRLCKFRRRINGGIVHHDDLERLPGGFGRRSNGSERARQLMFLIISRNDKREHPLTVAAVYDRRHLGIFRSLPAVTDRLYSYRDAASASMAIYSSRGGLKVSRTRVSSGVSTPCGTLAAR